MKITIHQPEHMPWTGFFHKMALAEKYVVLDNVQFKKNNWQNRNRIVDRSGTIQWISVPVNLRGHTSSTIKHTQIQNSPKWQHKYLGRIKGAYARHPYFKDYWPTLEEIISTEYDFIWQLNLELIHFFRSILKIETPLIFASTLNVEGQSSDLLIQICQELNATTYLAGADGSSYMEMNKFEQANIAVEFHAFTPPVYDAPKYEPGLTVLDILMNHGPYSREIIGI